MTDHEHPQPSPDLETLWQFAGQGLRSSDFNTAMVHFYRAEITRSNAWRSRLDATTNWAVISTGAAITFAFGSVQNTPVVLIFNTLLVILFLFIEARRYRYYELWTSRVRIMEQNFFAGLLSPPFLPHSDWADRIKQSLNQPRFPISLAEAFGRRYRRNYAPIFLILAISWLAKVAIHPTEVNSMAQFLERASTGPLPGWLVLLFGFLVHGSLIAAGLFTLGLQETTGEVVGGSPFRRVQAAVSEIFETEVPRIPQLDRRKQLVYIITDQGDAVSSVLLKEMRHGVTRLHGTGMYTGNAHSVLLIALEARQVGRLRKLVKGVDERAFVVITPVSGVHGAGFRPLEA